MFKDAMNSPIQIFLWTYMFIPFGVKSKIMRVNP